MSKVLAGITASLDGYVTGPRDRLGAGLGEGGERLHYWVFGGPWTYAGVVGPRRLLRDDRSRRRRLPVHLTP